MSNHLISMAYKRDLRTAMRKSVMVLLADKASDDGSGIYASKQTMADELCCSKQTVIDTVKAFLGEGLLIEIGQRRNANGFTVEYGINVAALEAIPLVGCHAARQSAKLTSQPAGPVNDVDVTSQPAGPHQSTSLTQTLIEPSITTQKATPSSSRTKREPTGTRLPDDWRPIKFGPDTIAREIIDRRGIDWGRRALESFRNHWHAANGPNARKRDWQAAWANWVIEQDRRDGNNGKRPANDFRDEPANPFLRPVRNAGSG
jgi:hypothetical protein